MSNNRKILVIDDEKMNILSLAHILKKQYEIIVATDGLTGIETAEKHLPDLILLDVVMPEMDGYEVIVKLKENEKTKNIPVIFISGLNGTEDEEKGIMFGAADYIVKPFNKYTVKKRVETQIKMIEFKETIDNLKNILGSQYDLGL